MLGRFGMANKLEDLPLYEKVQEFWVAVTEISSRPALRKDCDLHEQIESRLHRCKLEGGLRATARRVVCELRLYREGFHRRSHGADERGTRQGTCLGRGSSTDHGARRAA